MSDAAKITINYFCLGAFFIFIGSVLLCALGFTVVLPFELTRSWPAVVCSVVNSSFDPNVCSCDEQLSVFDTCVSKYPCLQIHVLYVPLLQQRDGKGPTKANATGVGRDRRSVDPGSEDSTAGGLRGSDAALPAAEEVRGETATGSDVTRHENITRKSSSLTDDDDDFLSTAPTSRANTGPTAVVSTEPAKNSRSSPSDDDVITSASPHPSTSLPGRYAGVEGHRSKVNGVTEEVGWSPDEAMHTDAYASESLQTRKTNGRGKADVERKGSGGNTISSNGSGLLGQSASGPAEPVIAVLYRSWEDSFHRQCSLTECGDEAWNVKEARRFRADWGEPAGKTFTCFYDPLRPDMVIIERTSTVAAVHAVFWPGLCLVGGVTLWIGLCLGCWSLGVESSCKGNYGPIY